MHLRNVAAILPFALLAACGGAGPEGEGSATGIPAADAPATETAAIAPSAAETSVSAVPAAEETTAAAATASPTPAAPASPVPASESPAAPSPAAASTKAAMAAPASFAICRACHAVEAGRNGVGPTLAGIVGSKAGEVPGYAFSPALKSSGIVWDRASLDTWLKSPMKMVPGTKMVMAVPDAAKRKDIIDYLETLK